MIFYGRLVTKPSSLPVPVLLHTIFDRIDDVLGMIAIDHGTLTIGEIRAENIRKLKARYPDKFSAADANERKDKVEA